MFQAPGTVDRGGEESILLVWVSRRIDVENNQRRPLLCSSEKVISARWNTKKA